MSGKKATDEPTTKPLPDPNEFRLTWQHVVGFILAVALLIIFAKALGF